MTIKEAVVNVLEDAPSGFSALDILREINTRFGWDYARESLSPQLSRLKQEGHINLTGRTWHLPEQSVPENEEPDPTLFTEGGSGASEPNPAKGREAGPGVVDEIIACQLNLPW